MEWKVAPGDTVTINQVLVEIETAKSLVELPSPFVGVVGEMLVAAGTTVDVGTPIITITSDAARAAPSAPAAAAPTPARGGPRPSPPMPARTITEDESPAVLVGRGAAATMPTRRKRHDGARVAHESMAPPARGIRPGGRHPAPTAVPAASVGPVITKPPIRKLAKDLGVDLAQVTPTGALGDVTREDVMREATQVSVFRNIQTPEWPTDREERIPVKGVRKAIAKAMVKSAFAAPHVSIFVDVDASRTMEFVKRLKASRDFEGVKVSPLLILAKAVIWAVRATRASTRPGSPRRRSSSSTS